MTTVLPAPPLILQFLDDDGTPLIGGQLYTTVGGVPFPTYADPAGQIQLANPIILNNRGEIATTSGQSTQLYLLPDTTYTFALFDRNGNPIDTPSNIQGIPTATSIQSLITSDFIGEIIYPQTDVEKSQNVTPDIFIPTLRIDPMRYGGTGDGFTDDTIAMQTALNIAQANNGTVWLGDNRNFLCGALALTFSGNRATEGLRIEGASVNGSMITQNGAMSGLLTLNAANPSGDPTELPCVLENFTLQCTDGLADALVLNNVSTVVVSHVYTMGSANRGIFLNSALIITIQDCWLNGGKYGVQARANGATGTPPNLIRILNNTISSQSTYAVDYDFGSELYLIGNDIEGNGTLGNIGTGAIRIGPNINAFPTFGFAKIWMQNNWVEGNNGSWSILVEPPGLGQQTNISIRGGHVVSAPSNGSFNQSVNITASRILIEDHISPSPSDTWALAGTYASLRNCNVSSLADTGVTNKDYTNVSTSTANYIEGFVSSFSGSLTGVTGTVTGNITVVQKGNSFKLIFPSTLVGTSTTTACTITGLPAAFTPSIDRNVPGAFLNNSAVAAGTITIGSAGVITLACVGGFTASGTKGIQAMTTPFYDR